MTLATPNEAWKVTLNAEEIGGEVHSTLSRMKRQHCFILLCSLIDSTLEFLRYFVLVADVSKTKWKLDEANIESKVLTDLDALAVHRVREKIRGSSCLFTCSHQVVVRREFAGIQSTI